MSETRVERRERERREEALRVRREEARRVRLEESRQGYGEEDLWELLEEVPQERRNEGYGYREEGAYSGYTEDYPWDSGENQSRDRKAEAARERKAEAARDRKAEAARERKAEAARERKAEAARERKAEAARERKAEEARERKAEAARERKAEAARERKAEAARSRKAEASRGRREEAYRESAREKKRARKRDRELELAWERERELEKKRGRAKAGAIIALIVFLLLAFTAFRVWMDTRPGAVEPIVGAADDLINEDRINVLFLGTNQGLSDTTMVFSFDMKNKRLDEISIPRDTYYYRSSYPGAAYQKINSVYSTEGYEGISRAASDVLGGIAIHYYAVLEDKGVARIVDAMGGVDMYVPIDMNYEDPDQGLYIHLQAGQQRLNGDQAMQYLRFRSGYNNADLGRIDAQQGFLKAVLAQSAGLDIPKVALVASNEATSNLSMTAAIGLMTRAGGMKDWAFNTWTIPGTTGMQDGLSYFFHDPAGTKEMMRQIYGEADSQAAE